MNDEAQADFDDALARAFARIEAAKKDSENPHFRNKYADLASVTEAIKGPLTSEGFSWPQTIAMEENAVAVTQWLRRKGVAISSTLVMPLGDKATPQQIGSAITYARRYALSAVVGVAPDDDDGHAASSNGGGQVRAPARQRRESKPKSQDEQPKPGGWRSNAPAEVLKADENARKLIKQRTRMIADQQVSREVMETNPGLRMCELAGLDPKLAKGGYDSIAPRLSMEQWADVIEGVRGDVADLIRTQAEDIAEKFDGTVEGAAE